MFIQKLSIMILVENDDSGCLLVNHKELQRSVTCSPKVEHHKTCLKIKIVVV